MAWLEIKFYPPPPISNGAALWLRGLIVQLVPSHHNTWYCGRVNHTSTPGCQLNTVKNYLKILLRKWTFDPYAEIFSIKHRQQRFFSIRIIIKFLVIPFCYIWIPMLWVYGHHKNNNSFSSGTAFRRQTLTSKDVMNILTSKNGSRAERVNLSWSHQ